MAELTTIVSLSAFPLIIVFCKLPSIVIKSIFPSPRINELVILPAAEMVSFCLPPYL